MYRCFDRGHELEVASLPLGRCEGGGGGGDVTLFLFTGRYRSDSPTVCLSVCQLSLLSPPPSPPTGFWKSVVGKNGIRGVALRRKVIITNSKKKRKIGEEGGRERGGGGGGG